MHVCVSRYSSGSCLCTVLVFDPPFVFISSGLHATYSVLYKLPLIIDIHLLHKTHVNGMKFLQPTYM